jgi:hypothetical protein
MFVLSFLLTLKPTIMKKIYFTTIIMTFVLTGFSQTGKGSWLLGGNIGFTSSSSTENGNKSSSSVFSLNPKIGIFPINNLAIILNTNYATLSFGGFSDHSLAIGPAVRYYFPGSTGVKFFVGTGVEFGSTGSNGGSSYHSTSYQFEAGPDFFITPAVAVELNVSYQTGTTKNSQEGSYNMKQSQFGVGVGFLIFLGGNKNKNTSPQN